MSAATSTQCCRECLAVHFSTGSSFPAEWDRADPRLQWNSVYGLSSFTYAAAGAFLLLCFDVAPEVQIPLRLEAACMGFQSLATYMADVRNIGVASAWHPFDRLVATINTVFLGCNLIWVPWIERVAYLLIVASGVIVLARSREARKFGALDTFARAHALWHLWLPSGLTSSNSSNRPAMPPFAHKPELCVSCRVGPVAGVSAAWPCA